MLAAMLLQSSPLVPAQIRVNSSQLNIADMSIGLQLRGSRQHGW